MSDREEILARLRGKAKPATMPEPWRSRRQYDDLADVFCAALVSAGGEARPVSSLAEARRIIGAILEEVEASRVLVHPDLPLDLPGQWPQLAWYVVGQNEGDLRDFAPQADVGITSVAGALAETGSLIVATGPHVSRQGSLMPPLHIALVPRSAITADLFTWTAARKGEMPTNVVLISGPSKSADIGMTLTTGVHGPGRVIALVYDDIMQEE